MFKKIIEWFLKKAWPVILAFLVKYGAEIVEFIFKIIKEKMDKMRQKQQEEHMKKAQEDLETALFVCTWINN